MICFFPPIYSSPPLLANNLSFFIVHILDVSYEIDSKNRTEFHLACQEGDHEMAKLFLDNYCQTDIDLNEKDNINGHSGFHLACFYGHVNVVRLLFDYPDLIQFDALNDSGLNGLQLAFSQKNFKVAENILQVLGAEGSFSLYFLLKSA